MRSVGVIGLGAVGWAAVHGMSRYYPCSIYDKVGRYDWDAILRTDLVLVCVSTPEGTDGRLDCSAISDVADRLDRDAYPGIVVVKSTVGVGFMDRVSERFPRLRLVYMPEFLREKSRFTWFIHPDRIVLAGSPKDIEETLSYFSWTEDATILRTDYRSAEVGKLAHNAYIATKVSFTNEMEAISKVTGADAVAVMKVVTADRRVVSEEHLRPGFGPYNGKCVPKDTAELSAAGGGVTSLLRAVKEVHDRTAPVPRLANSAKVVVVVTTANEGERLTRTLDSIVTQIRKPDQVIVVSEGDPGLQYLTESLLGLYRDRLTIDVVGSLPGERHSELVNRAVDNARKRFQCQVDCFVAFIGEGDWWERYYLDNLLNLASDTGADWVISGMIQPTDGLVLGREEIIADRVRMKDLSATPSCVQQSNLFIRLSRILEAGGFDEESRYGTFQGLVSRLIGLPDVHYEILRNHLVHRESEDSYTKSEEMRQRTPPLAG